MPNVENESESHINPAANIQADVGAPPRNEGVPIPPAPVALDAAMVEAIRSVVAEAIAGLTTQGNQPTPVVPTAQAAISNDYGHAGGGTYNQALKAISSMRPDSYDGTGEPVKVSYWFIHIERLFRNIMCTEAEKVHIASLQLRGGASEWWENTGLANHPGLNWNMFKTKMIDRFFSRAMREEKRKEFLYPDNRGLKVTELAAKFNHLLHYSGPDMMSEEQKIWHLNEWMSADLQALMLRHGCTTLEQYVDAAFQAEVVLEKKESSENIP